MANVIRHKRGTSNPAAGNFSQTAELLVNTSDGGVFTKTDGGSVVEVGSNASNLSTGTVPSGRLSGSYGISVTGSSASCTGNAASATVLQTARTIGGVSFNGSANINLPGVNTAGNQNTSGSSASCTGNAATATTLQTARTINGVSFNGSANITVESYVENDESTNATRYLTFVDNTTASYKRLNEDSSLTYNPSSNVLSAGTFSGSGASLSSLNASNLSSGTVPSGRLSGSYGISITGSAGSVSSTLSRGSYLTGSNFNGSSATTWAVDATSSNTANKVVARDGNGDFSGRYITANYLNMSHSQSARSSDTIFYSSNDNYVRKNTASGFRSALSVPGLTTNNTFTLAQRGQVDGLGSSSSITPNFANSNNFSLTLATNTTINNPSNLVAGQSGAITIYYSGNRTVAFGSYWKFPGGTAPTMTSTSGKYDVIVYYVESSTRISAAVLLNTGG